MLFRTFHSQKERREFGGSYFIEIQYCRLPPNAKIEEFLSGEHEMELWKNDSLYIYGVCSKCTWAKRRKKKDK